MSSASRIAKNLKGTRFLWRFLMQHDQPLQRRNSRLLELAQKLDRQLRHCALVIKVVRLLRHNHALRLRLCMLAL